MNATPSTCELPLGSLNLMTVDAANDIYGDGCLLHDDKRQNSEEQQLKDSKMFKNNHVQGHELSFSQPSATAAPCWLVKYLRSARCWTAVRGGRFFSLHTRAFPWISQDFGNLILNRVCG